MEERPQPAIGAGELLVKVFASGICGTDVMEWYRIKKAPLVLGHEIAGIVEKTGENIKDFKNGDRVFVTHHVPCNTCRYCLNDDHTICHTFHTTKFYPGGFAEYLRVPSINVDRGTFKKIRIRTKWKIRHSKIFNRTFVRLDDLFDYGRKKDSDKFWVKG